MKRIALFFAFLGFTLSSLAFTLNHPVIYKNNIVESPTAKSHQLITTSVLATLKIKAIEQLIGRKLKLKERLALKVYQWKIKREAKRKTETSDDKGQTSLILGISALASLFIPYVGIAAIPCAILAIIFGNQAKKVNPKDRKAKTGVLLGWLTIGLLVVVMALVIAIIASGGFFGF